MKKLLTIVFMCIFIGLVFSSNIIADNQDNMITNTTLSSNDVKWEYNFSTNGWSIEFPANITNYTISWKVNIRNRPLAHLRFKHQYEFNHISNEGAIYDSSGYFELSCDDGENWTVLEVFEGKSEGIFEEIYDFSSWHGGSVTIRFRVEGVGDSGFISEYGGKWSFWDLIFYGMGDNIPPIPSVTVTGLMYDGRDGWRCTQDYYQLSTYDDFSGIREFIIIHNNSIAGTEVTVLNKPYFNFSLFKNGINDFYFWGVDLCGNIGNQFNLTNRKVDMECPTFEIFAPDSGLYIFDRRILPLKKPFIIGDFTIQVVAFDAVSGIYEVEFFLDGEFIGSDSEEPYELNCNIKHKGEGKICVAVEDVAMNSVGKTIEIEYYNFFGE